MAPVAHALTIHENTRFSGKIITNISAAYATTGVFVHVPEATAEMPVPFWQMTNAISTHTQALQQMPRTLASGECDTNRVDVLFSTNYVISAVYVWQPEARPNQVTVYTNGVSVDTFSFSDITGSKAVTLALGRFDRLGIAASSTAHVVQFAFEGTR